MHLLYVVALACSLWALIGGMVTLEWSTTTHHGFVGPRTKVVSSVLMVQALLVYVLLLGDETPAALTGSLRPSLHGTGLLITPVHVLDMAVLLPAILVTGVWLRRQQPIAYWLGALMLVNLAFQGLGNTVMMVFAIRAGCPGSLWLAGIVVALSAGNAALLVW